MFGLLKIFFKFYNRFFSPDKLFAKRLRSLVGFTPSNIGIFKLAFYHKSASSEKLYAVQSNERLEYLGDAVLGTIVAEYLFKKYPQKDEGFLTKMRSKIVKRQSLNKIADKMGLDVFLNQYNNTRLSRSMLGNALEALVGAVYIERGYNQTRQYVIQKILRGYLDIHELESFDDNYKSQLLEWCQKNGQTVSYKMLAKYKFEKRDRFKVAVLIDGKKLAAADDFNKKSAEQTASEKAMQLLGLLKEEKEDENGKQKPRNPRNNRNPRPSRSREEQSNDRAKRNSDSRNKKNPLRNKDSKPKPTAVRKNKVEKKESSDWADVKLDIPDDTTQNKSSKTSQNSKSRSSSKPNAPRRNNSKNKTVEKGQSVENNKQVSNRKKEEKVSKPEQKRRAPQRKPRPKPKTVTEEKSSDSPREPAINKTEKPARIVKKQIEKKERKPKITQDNKGRADSGKAEVKENERERPPRRNNSRNSNRSSERKQKAPEVEIEESIEIEIPVNLTQDIVEKTKSRITKPPSTDATDDTPAG